jgi:hypothetical protein
MFWEILKSATHEVVWADKSPRGRIFWIAVFVSVFLLEVGVFIVQRQLHDLADEVALAVILLAPAIYVLIGFGRARSADPIRNLFEQPGAKEAPYLLACAAALQQKPGVSVFDKKEAIEELSNELCELKNEHKYIAGVIEDIENHAVWAVCGRKTNEAAPSFFEANLKSYRNHNYIERLFLPPTTSTEAGSIQNAIEHYHFPNGMLVGVLKPELDADAVRHTHSLPPGFGMTIMGNRNRTETNEKRDPESMYAVLIHWGGMEAGRHYGVILRKDVWLDYFWDVFFKIRGNTDIANPGGVNRDWENLVEEYPAYGRAN